jgi:dephospho-CoA kinase
MIRIGILGDIGSGKSFVAKSFGYPVFNADNEVGKLYKKNRKIFTKLNKALPKYITQFPIKKEEVTKTILANKNNLRKIIKIIHPEIRKKMNIFLKKNKKRKLIILDIPLLLENKINKRKDILIFVQSNRTEILKKLKKRQNFNSKMMNRFRKIQLPLDYKRKKSKFIIKNNFTNRFIKKQIKYILNQIY